MWRIVDVVARWLRVEVLREVIGQVFVGIDVSDSDSELSLTCAISNPVESHVHGFGAPLFDGVGGNSDCCSIVSHDDDRILGVSEVSEDGR